MENTPKKNNNGIVVLIVIVVFILLIFFILFIFGFVAALVLPSLSYREEGFAAIIRMKKAISQYEQITYVYMAEEEKEDLRSFAGQNCEKLGNYFKIYKSHGNCAFETEDKVYWQFNPLDGSTLVSDKKQNPTYTIKMGVCKNKSEWTRVNCPEEYPDVEKMLQTNK